jgi:dethiobiotin synthetase
MSVRGLFVTGTDTGVGKTRIAAGIVARLRAGGRCVGAVKPVASGAERGPDGGLVWGDAEALAAAAGGVDPWRVVPLRYEPPLAPPVAARLAGAPLGYGRIRESTEAALAWWAEQGAEVVVVEGVGGLLCPLAEGATVADLATDLDFPLVVVARRGLGTLNHTLLTVEAARLRGLRLAGVVLNGSEPTTNPLAEATNAAELARRLEGVALLGEVPHDPAAPEAVAPPALDLVDWYGWAAPPRGAAPAWSQGSPASRDA